MELWFAWNKSGRLLWWRTWCKVLACCLLLKLMYFLVNFFVCLKIIIFVWGFLRPGPCFWGSYFHLQLASLLIWYKFPRLLFPLLPQLFLSCSIKLSSRTQAFMDNKYAEFLISISNDEETWNMGSEGRVLTTVPESFWQSRDLCSCIGSLRDILGIGSIVLHIRSF